MQLARCGYIEGREKVIAIGNSGTGVNAQGRREVLGMDVVPGGDQDGML
jgi:transposase-like protein